MSQPAIAVSNKPPPPDRPTKIMLGCLIAIVVCVIVFAIGKCVHDAHNDDSLQDGGTLDAMSGALEQKVMGQHAYRRARQIRIEAARKDPGAFNRLVLRDEETGRPISQGPIHDDWQDILNEEKQVVIWSHIEAGKTNQITIGRVLWELGNNPNLRVCIVSNKEKTAAKIMRSIAQYILRSKELHEVFPKLKPHDDRQMPWNTEQIVVQRDGYAKDPSVQCAGIGVEVISARIDLLIFDDALDAKNTQSKEGREETLRRVKTGYFSRLTAQSRVWFVGNAWHPQDAMHELTKEAGFSGYRFPVADENGNLSWPEQWPADRIEKQKRIMGPLEAARALFCMARDDAQSRFKREWIDVGVKQGRGFRLVSRIDPHDLPPGYAIVHGVDLAVQKTAKSDLSSIFSILLWPNGKRQVIAIQSGRWGGPETLRRIDDTSDRLGGFFIVENNQAQDFLLQFAAEGISRATLRPFTTGRNKAHPEFGLEGVAVELNNGKWIIPNRDGRFDPEVEAWIAEMLYYDPRKHTGDRLMASWFAREGCRVLERYGVQNESEEGTIGVLSIGSDQGGETFDDAPEDEDEMLASAAE